MYPAHTGYTQESLRAASDTHPAGVERALYALDLPEVVEQFEIFDQRCGVKNSVDRSIYLVFEREDIPADLSVRILEHPRVKTTKNIGWVILRIR